MALGLWSIPYHWISEQMSLNSVSGQESSNGSNYLSEISIWDRLGGEPEPYISTVDPEFDLVTSNSQTFESVDITPTS